MNRTKRYRIVLWLLFLVNGIAGHAPAQINIPHFILSGMHNLSEGKFTDAIRSLNDVINASPALFEP